MQEFLKILFASGQKGFELAFFVLMPVTIWQVRDGVLADWDNVLIIALFHTAFSMMGAMLFMPFTHQLQRLLERLIPERIDASNTHYLDESLFSMPAVAIGAAKEALCRTAADTFHQFTKACRGEMAGQQIDTLPLDDCLIKVDDYLQKMPVPQSQTDQERLMALLQLVVYIRVIREDLANSAFIDVLRRDFDENLAAAVVQFEALTAYLNAMPKRLPPEFVSQFVAFDDDMKAQKIDVRLSIIEHSAHTQHSASDALNLIVARRWLDRLVKHTAKMVILLGK